MLWIRLLSVVLVMFVIVSVEVFWLGFMGIGSCVICDVKFMFEV